MTAHAGACAMVSGLDRYGSEGCPRSAGAMVTDSVWGKIEYDVTAYKNSAFRVRFGYSIGAGAYVMSSWNVDDVTPSTTSCP